MDRMDVSHVVLVTLQVWRERATVSRVRQPFRLVRVQLDAKSEVSICQSKSHSFSDLLYADSL